MEETGQLQCWRCGADLNELSLPLRRLEQCPACSTELHVCKLCEFYDPAVADACREPVAEQVRNKEEANFCDYFRPTPNAYHSLAAEQQQAASALDAMFGDEQDKTDQDPTDALNDLFKKSE